MRIEQHVITLPQSKTSFTHQWLIILLSVRATPSRVSTNAKVGGDPQQCVGWLRKNKFKCNTFALAYVLGCVPIVVGVTCMCVKCVWDDHGGLELRKVGLA